MRTTVYNLLRGVSIDIPDERIYQMGSIDETPVRPFMVYRLTGGGSGVTANHPSKAVRLEVWVHDQPGSYTRIDDTLRDVEERFADVLHASYREGESISQIAFDSRSPDLDDTGFRTICRMSSFTLIGKGQ
ncbi:tail terminator [Arthrobacter phage Wollypog]|uniref:Tail terminator n=1 Tax=Arthrobacter phage Wollypog TaxID=2790985 RepID=A0A7T3KCI3_9CAUD|nr:tail terminator [Arthrobacter phage Wollypog]QPX62564.1 tail terminator [Arthrobacter phage Wollypog]